MTFVIKIVKLIELGDLGYLTQLSVSFVLVNVHVWLILVTGIFAPSGGILKFQNGNYRWPCYEGTWAKIILSRVRRLRHAVSFARDLLVWWYHGFSPFYPPQFCLKPSLGLFPWELGYKCWSQKARFPGLPNDRKRMILRSIVLTHDQRVTDEQTDGTARRLWLSCALWCIWAR